MTLVGRKEVSIQELEIVNLTVESWLYTCREVHRTLDWLQSSPNE